MAFPFDDLDASACLELRTGNSSELPIPGESLYIEVEAVREAICKSLFFKSLRQGYLFFDVFGRAREEDIVRINIELAQILYEKLRVAGGDFFRRRVFACCTGRYLVNALVAIADEMT